MLSWLRGSNQLIVILGPCGSARPLHVDQRHDYITAHFIELWLHVCSSYLS